MPSEVQFIFFYVFYCNLKGKIIFGEISIMKKEMFLCKISNIIIFILICQKLGTVGPVQQKIKLPCLM